VACWGRNLNGVTGQAVSEPVQSYPQYLALTGVRSVTAGDGHACAIVDAESESQIWCWGSNEWGQLGPAPAPGQYAFTEVPQLVPLPD
jgi:alpha-tubulin suppressor-like RCC1 family protein